MPLRVRVLVFSLTLILLSLPIPITAQVATQNAPCGVVDALQFPIENLVETSLIPGFDDFGLYRARFGGNHTGFDMAFDQQGAPIHAAARGRVTYSDIEGWDTERGVVILEHIFPDNSRYYTLYGHVEQTDTITLPLVGTCVEMGDVIAAVGWPSLGAPHLHFEVRDFNPDDGGPGYVTTNPLNEGWYHPLDFLMLWQMRLLPGYIEYATFDTVPTLPPVQQDNGSTVIASGSTLLAYPAPGSGIPNVSLWRVTTDGDVTGLAALPGDRVVAHTINGQVAVLTNGRYTALWTVAGPDVPFITLGETLIFVTPGGGLSATDSTGQSLWSIPAPEMDAEVRIDHFLTNGTQMAVAVRSGGQNHWRVVNSAGQIVYEADFRTRPVVAPIMGGWMLIADGDLMRVTGSESTIINQATIAPGLTARLAADVVGNTYLYAGDAENTLLSYTPSGAQRWQVRYPALTEGLLPPLMRTDTGCLLYVLDVDGRLNIFNAADGTLALQTGLYPGGNRNGHPSARLLELGAGSRLRIGAGFLSTITMDATALNADALTRCLLG